MYSKKILKQAVNHAFKMKEKTKKTEVLFQIYSGSIYILDTEEDKVIDVCKTEKDAIDCINGIDKESGFKTGCYYKPILVDMFTGERITRKNINRYE